jgi:hypothetical protein
MWSLAGFLLFADVFLLAYFAPSLIRCQNAFSRADSTIAQEIVAPKTQNWQFLQIFTIDDGVAPISAGSVLGMTQTNTNSFGNQSGVEALRRDLSQANPNKCR